MASHVADDICMDDTCHEHAMEVFHEEMSDADWVTEDMVREFIMFVEGIAGYEDAPPQAEIKCFKPYDNKGESHGIW